MWFFVSLLLLPYIMAEPELYYKIDDTIDINVPCFNNGVFCSNNTNCNISINDPYSTNLVNNQLMTNGGSFHNYTFNPTMLGDYQTVVSCMDTSDNASTTFTFQVNNIGRKIDNFLGIVIFLVILVIISISVTILLIAGDNILMYPSMLVTSLSFTILFFMIYMNTMGLSRIFYVLYWSFLILSFVVFILILWEITIKYITVWSHKGQNKNQYNDTF